MINTYEIKIPTMVLLGNLDLNVIRKVIGRNRRVNGFEKIDAMKSKGESVHFL